jgi:hypothetical protein
MATINASFLDMIEWFEHYEKLLKKPIGFTIGHDIDPNSITKDDLIKIISSCENYSFEEGYLFYTVSANELDIEKKKTEYITGLKSSVFQLRKWYRTKLEWSEMLSTWLNEHSQKYILNLIVSNELDIEFDNFINTLINK